MTTGYGRGGAEKARKGLNAAIGVAILVLTAAQKVGPNFTFALPSPARAAILGALSNPVIHGDTHFCIEQQLSLDEILARPGRREFPWTFGRRGLLFMLRSRFREEKMGEVIQLSRIRARKSYGDLQDGLSNRWVNPRPRMAQNPDLLGLIRQLALAVGVDPALIRGDGRDGGADRSK